MPIDDTKSQPILPPAGTLPSEALVTVESQREFDLLSGQRSERTFLKLYVEARTSGLLAAISDRDWKTLCVLATYMDADGYCYPSQVELARAMGCSRQMANDRIKSLASFRFQGKPVLLVQREGRSEQGTWSRNGYHVLPIANLGIFDSDDERSDRRKTNRPKWTKVEQNLSDQPMSRSLDMASESRNLDTAHSITVSSRTVPVELDTNKNQETNKNQIHSSNIRKATTSTDDKDEGDERSTTQVAKSRGQMEHLGETLKQRHLPRGVVRVKHDPDRDVIVDYIADFSRELADRAPLKSSTTRAYNLYRQSGLPLETFLEGLYRARAIVKERTGVIRSSDGSGGGSGSTKNKMAYFFAVLEDLLGLREDDHRATTR